MTPAECFEALAAGEMSPDEAARILWRRELGWRAMSLLQGAILGFTVAMGWFR